MTLSRKLPIALRYGVLLMEGVRGSGGGTKGRSVACPLCLEESTSLLQGSGEIASKKCGRSSFCCYWLPKALKYGVFFILSPNDIPVLFKTGLSVAFLISRSSESPG